jgi:mRNA interferase MazF
MVKIKPTMLNKLGKDSTADCFQVKSLSTNRFVSKLGEMDETDFQKIKDSLKIVFDL